MKILLADPQPNIRYGLNILLTEQSGMDVVGQVTEKTRVLASIEAARPDVILLSWQWANSTHNQLLQITSQQYPKLKIILMSSRIEIREQALGLPGVDAFICQADPPEHLLDALRGMIEDE